MCLYCEVLSDQFCCIAESEQMTAPLHVRIHHIKELGTRFGQCLQMQTSSSSSYTVGWSALI